MENKLQKLSDEFKQIVFDSVKSSEEVILRKITEEFLRREKVLLDTFRDELAVRDNKIEALEKELENQKAPSHPPPFLPLPPNRAACPELEDDVFNNYIENNCDNISGPQCAASKSDTREKCDLLLIGDSIVKYVDLDKYDQLGMSYMNVCIPGARSQAIRSRIVELNLKYSFGHVIVHVGSNYLPRTSSFYAARKVTELLIGVKEIMPDTIVDFSPILPKIGPEMLVTIHSVNRWIIEEVRDHGIGYVVTTIGTRFGTSYDADKSFICWDGTHLSYAGVEAYEYGILEHLGFS